jgi:hypothetical protein
MTLFIEFPASYQWVGGGNQLATSKGTLVAILTVGCAANNHEAAVFSPAFELLAVALTVKSFKGDYQRRKQRTSPFG